MRLCWRKSRSRDLVLMNPKQSIDTKPQMRTNEKLRVAKPRAKAKRTVVNQKPKIKTKSTPQREKKAKFALRAKITARISHLAVGTFSFFQKKKLKIQGGKIFKKSF